MKTILVVTKDVITGECTTSPNMYRNEADAKRAWGNAIAELSRDPKTNVPYKDFTLHKVADFDTESLEITPCNKYLAGAGEFIDYSKKGE